MELERRQDGMKKAATANRGSLETVERLTQRAVNITNPERSSNRHEFADAF
jgi:hypothetical protein